jgi:hypothetical protein
MTLLVRRQGTKNVIFGSNLSVVPRWEIDQNFSGVLRYPIENTFGYGPFFDEVLYLLSTMELYDECRSIPSAIGHAVSVPFSDHRYFGMEPLPSRISPDAWRPWENIVYHTQSLFSDWDFKRSSGVDFNVRENPVTHFNVYGHIRANLAVTDFIREPVGGIYASIPAEPVYEVAFYGPEGSPSVGFTQNAFTTSITQSAMSNLHWFSDAVNDGNYDGATTNPYVTRRYSNFEYSMREHTVDWIAYAVSNYLDHPGHWWIWDVSWVVSIFLRFRLIQPIPWNTVVDIRDYIHLDYSINFERKSFRWSTKAEPNIWHDGSSGFPDWTLPPFYGFTYASPGFISAVSHLDKVDDYLGCVPSVNKYIGLGGNERGFNSFVDVGNRVIRDCYPAVFFSTKDAVEKHFDQLESNHIEALLELRDLGDLLNPIQLMRRISARKLTGYRLLIALFDLLTDVKLLYSFGIAPTISDAKDIVKRSRDIRTKYFILADFSKIVTTYGDFLYSIEDEIIAPFDYMILKARSKVRLSLSADSVLMALLPVRSLGLLPSLSQLWDLVPLSFLADWFTPIDEYLDAVDTQAIFLGLECHYAVHSVNLSYTFSQDDRAMFDFGFLGEGSEVFEESGYRLYVRWVDGNLPVLTSSRLDFFGGPHIPDYGTLGSLLYKIIK